MAVPAPRNIRSLRADGVLELTWQDGSSVSLPFRYLRGRCSCASCVNEFTGERIVGIAEVPEAISIEGAELVGNYALRIQWNDRHNTGLYTWDYLKQLCDSGEWKSLTPSDSSLGPR